jgi:hypothetical protein
VAGAGFNSKEGHMKLWPRVKGQRVRNSFPSWLNA